MHIFKQKRWVVISSVVALVAILLLGWWAYNMSITSQMKSIASQFKPGDSWHLQHVSTVNPTPFCIHDTPCPYYTETWHVDTPLSPSDFNKVLATSSFDSKPSTNCSLDPKQEGRSTTCKAIYVQKGYRITIRVNTVQQPRTSDDVILSVEKFND